MLTLLINMDILQKKHIHSNNIEFPFIIIFYELIS